MMEDREIAGRFLPARVYSRWKWAVHFGLFVVTALVLLSGGLALFFKPAKYKSKGVVEIENGRSPQESAVMMESSGILGRVVDEFDFSRRWETDKETTIRNLEEQIELKVIPDTQLIAISVVLMDKGLARDVAESLPRHLAAFEKERSRIAASEKVAKFDTLIHNASDVAAEKAVAVANIEKFHSGTAPDETAARELERARRASVVADAEVERLQVLRGEAASEAVGTEPRLIVHAEPQISDNPVDPKAEPEVTELALEALLSGLLTALLLPYLLELAVPVRKEGEILPDLVESL